MTPQSTAIVEERQRSAELDRRRFLKRAATIAWATPALVTIMSTPAYGQLACPSGNTLGGTCSTTTPTCDTVTGCCCCGVTGGCLGSQACGASQTGRCCFPDNFGGAANPCAANGTNNAPMASCCSGKCGAGANKTVCLA